LPVVVELLGAPKFLDEEMEERTKDPGVAIGLAWTPAGGEVLFIEASRMAGAAALTLTGLARKMLFGITPTQPSVFALSAAVLAGAALAAGWLPARRAARVDPMVALRHE